MASVIQDQATSLVLDSNANGNVYTDQFNGSSSQQWALATVGPANILFIQNVATGLFLEGIGAPGFGNVLTNPFNGSTFQQWGLILNSFLIQHVESGLVLDSNAGGNVYTNSPNGGPFQNWTLFSMAAMTEKELTSLPKAPPIPASAPVAPSRHTSPAA